MASKTGIELPDNTEAAQRKSNLQVVSSISPEFEELSAQPVSSMQKIVISAYETSPKDNDTRLGYPAIIEDLSQSYLQISSMFTELYDSLLWSHSTRALLIGSGLLYLHIINSIQSNETTTPIRDSLSALYADFRNYFSYCDMEQDSETTVTPCLQLLNYFAHWSEGELEQLTLSASKGKTDMDELENVIPIKTRNMQKIVQNAHDKKKK